MYLVCLGRQDIFGNQAIPSSQVKHIYKDFRFRDPTCRDTGRTQVLQYIPFPQYDALSIVVESVKSNPTIDPGYETDYQGLVWRQHEGNKPTDHQFDRRLRPFPFSGSKNIDSRPDRWAFGTQTYEKNQIPSSDGYLMSSTIKVQKERGVIT